MASEKYSKWFRVFVVIALVVSVGMNMSFLSKLNWLENEINVVSSNQHSIMNQINNQTHHIQDVMNDIKNEQSWISTINMDVDPNAINDGQAEVTFSWQVKELHKDSEVIFNYVYGNRVDYITVPAEELQQGMFQVKVPFKLEMEPQWEVGLTNETQHESTKVEMEDVRIEDERKNTLKYFVSVSYEDMVKSGEIHTEYLGHYGTSFYGIIQAELYMHDKKNFDVMLVNHHISNPSMVVEEAYLLKYKGETFIGEEKIELEGQDNPPDEHSVRFFHLNQQEQYENMRLVIRVTYSNGETFEKEVY